MWHFFKQIAMIFHTYIFNNSITFDPRLSVRSGLVSSHKTLIVNVERRMHDGKQFHRCQSPAHEVRQSSRRENIFIFRPATQGANNNTNCVCSLSPMKQHEAIHSPFDIHKQGFVSLYPKDYAKMSTKFLSPLFEKVSLVLMTNYK